MVRRLKKQKITWLSPPALTRYTVRDYEREREGAKQRKTFKCFQQMKHKQFSNLLLCFEYKKMDQCVELHRNNILC